MMIIKSLNITKIEIVYNKGKNISFMIFIF